MIKVQFVYGLEDEMLLGKGTVKLGYFSTELGEKIFLKLRKQFASHVKPFDTLLECIKVYMQRQKTLVEDTATTNLKIHLTLRYCI